MALRITHVSHAVNHFQSQMVAVLYPTMMVELGFGFAQLGMLTAVRTLLSNATQITYGFLTQLSSRPILLAGGNALLAAGTMLTGLVGSFGGLVGARAVAAVGQSAQHPVGSSLLASLYPEKRATVLALNASIANIGSLVAPLLATLLLLSLGWRAIFILVAVLSGAVAAAYLLLRDRVGVRQPPGTRGWERLAAAGRSYLRALRDRNVLVISLVMMVGAAGRGEGVTVVYLAPHLVTDLGLEAIVAGVALTILQVGAIIGPVGFGWAADRISRRIVLSATLALSAVMTWVLAQLGPTIWVLFPALLAYGAVAYSRNPLTQAVVADAVRDEDRDAAFSLYYTIGFASGPVWSLITGVLMELYGFTLAFSSLALTYVAGMFLVLFLADPWRPHRTTIAHAREDTDTA
jgi:FSR family fosmidomycin resistance protein-like MFS transporter